MRRMCSPELHNQLDVDDRFSASSPLRLFAASRTGTLTSLRRIWPTGTSRSVYASDEALQWLARHGFQPAMSTRPLARLIERTVELRSAETSSVLQCLLRKTAARSRFMWSTAKLHAGGRANYHGATVRTNTSVTILH